MSVQQVQTPLRIGVVSHDCFWPLKGGGGIRVYWVTKAMIQRQHDVCVIAPLQTREGIEEEFGPIPVLSAGKLTRFVKFKEIKYIGLMARIFIRLLCQRFDVLYAHNAVAGLPTILISKLKKIPVVFDFDDLLTGYSKISFVYRFGPKMERWVAKRANLTIVNSRVVQQWCKKHGIHRTVIIRHGVDLSRFKAVDRERKYITFTGGMEVNDGVLLIPQAAQEVLKEFPDEMFMMVGDGKDKQNLRQRVETLGLSRSFILKGWRDQGEIPGILTESKIGLITMLKVSATELSTRLSSYEYMASGVPFITSDLDCSQEQVQESNAGILFENGNPQSLAQGILQLLKDKTLWNTLSQNGQRYVKEHADWRKNARAICLACEKVASEEKID